MRAFAISVEGFDETRSRVVWNVPSKVRDASGVAVTTKMRVLRRVELGARGEKTDADEDDDDEDDDGDDGNDAETHRENDGNISVDTRRRVDVRV